MLKAKKRKKILEKVHSPLQIGYNRFSVREKKILCEFILLYLFVYSNVLNCAFLFLFIPFLIDPAFFIDIKTNYV